MGRYSELKFYIKNLRRVIVAFSGGIDSYLVLKASLDALGKENVLAVTGESPSLKESEKRQAVELAKEIDANHLVIQTKELENPNYYENPANRCFYCKDELFTKLNELKNLPPRPGRGSWGGETHILDGTNYDDLSDHRPGYKAAKENGIVSPLAELKFTKNEIRDISKELGLRIWDKPSQPCLSSRIPYGQQVTIPKLIMIEQAEKIIEELGFREYRVRHFEFAQNGKTMKLAKVDIGKDEMGKVMSKDLFRKIDSHLRGLGYDFVTLDMGGLKSGSLNLTTEKQRSVE
jgi:uncharacterized protein